MSKNANLNTKEKIIIVATDLFIEKGSMNINLREIAEELKISTPAIYRHFESLDDLILEACRYWVLESKKFNRDGDRELQKASFQIRSYVERHIEYTYKNRGHFSLLLDVYHRAISSPEMLSLYQDIKNGALAKIQYILQLGNIDGSWKIKNYQEIAELIHSLVVAEVIKALVDPKEASKDRRLHRCLTGLNLILKASFES